jgi:hypothetical protein
MAEIVWIKFPVVYDNRATNGEGSEGLDSFRCRQKKKRKMSFWSYPNLNLVPRVRGSSVARWRHGDHRRWEG